LLMVDVRPKQSSWPRVCLYGMAHDRCW
jgi:hypothetical protein